MLEEAQTDQRDPPKGSPKIMKEVRKQAKRTPGRPELCSESLIGNNESTGQNNTELGKF